MVAAEVVQYLGRPGAPVEDIPDDVQLIHDHPLGQVAEGGDKGLRPVDLNDGVHDALKVFLAVGVVLVGVHQLVDDVLEVGGQRLAHLGTGVLGGGGPADGDQLVEDVPVPIGGDLVGPAQFGQLPLRVIDEGGQQVLPLRRHLLPKTLVDFPPDGAGGVAEDVGEALILPVDVADEVLGALGEVQNGPEVDDLGGGGLDVGPALGQQPQVL